MFKLERMFLTIWLTLIETYSDKLPQENECSILPYKSDRLDSRLSHFKKRQKLKCGLKYRRQKT